jgi:hypothetical protein
MFGPLGLRGYTKAGSKINFTNPATWSQAERDRAKGDYSQNRQPQNAWERFSGTVFGSNPMPPYLDPKTVQAKDAVSQYMGFLTAKRGIVGRMSPTTAGVATDVGLSAMGALGGALAPGPVIGGLSAAVNVVSNYYDDKEAAITKLSEAGYSTKDLESSFRDYESQLVSGLDRVGGGEGGKEYSEYDRQLAQGLKAQMEGEDMKTSTSQASNVEEMRSARKKKTQRIFGGQLGSTDSGNQVKKAKLLGQ